MFEKGSRKLKRMATSLALIFNCVAGTAFASADSTAAAPPKAPVDTSVVDTTAHQTTAPVPVSIDTTIRVPITANRDTTIRLPVVVGDTTVHISATIDTSALQLPPAPPPSIPQAGYWRAPQLNCVALIQQLPNGKLRLVIADVDPREGRPYLYFSNPKVRDYYDRLGEARGEPHVERLVPPESATSVIGHVPKTDINPTGDGKYKGNIDVPGKRMKLDIEIRMTDQNHMDVKVCGKIVIRLCKSATWERVAQPKDFFFPDP